MDKNSKNGWRYSAEEKAAAVRMVWTLRVGVGTNRGTVQRDSLQLGYGVESVRSRVNKRPSMTALQAASPQDGQMEIRRLEQKTVD